MAIVKPFCGVLYNKKKVKDISKVVAPPYDVISQARHNELYKTSAYNFVRLILDKKYPIESASKKKYDKAAYFLKTWLKKGILLKDKMPAIYIYEQDYYYDNAKKTRVGFLALLKLEGFKKNIVHPHEKIFPVPKKDRIMIISKLHANLSPVFSLFLDKNGRIDRVLRHACKGQPPYINIKFEKVGHKLWRLTNQDLIKKIIRNLKDKQVFIADGHHRYGAALRLRDMMYKNKGKTRETQDLYGYCLMYFLGLNAKGLTIMATHRLIKSRYCRDIASVYEKLSGIVSIKRYNTKTKMLVALKNTKTGEYLFGMYLKNGGFYVLKLKKEAIKNSNQLLDALDVNILHNLILSRLGFKANTDKDIGIRYTVNIDEAIESVEEKRFDAAIFLNPTKITQVKGIAESGQMMPHKSTYFYPKLLSGLVLYQFD